MIPCHETPFNVLHFLGDYLLRKPSYAVPFIVMSCYLMPSYMAPVNVMPYYMTHFIVMPCKVMLFSGIPFPVRNSIEHVVVILRSVTQVIGAKLGIEEKGEWSINILYGF